jgi:ATP-dependent Clp protease adaptor protein ClpS
MGDSENIRERESEGGLSVDDELSEPKMYRVVMHNDHYTTMDFVIESLVQVFRKEEPEAYRIMMEIHQQGSGICGIFTLDIALTKIAEVHKRAREKGFPLKCSHEEV